MLLLLVEVMLLVMMLMVVIGRGSIHRFRIKLWLWWAVFKDGHPVLSGWRWWWNIGRWWRIPGDWSIRNSIDWHGQVNIDGRWSIRVCWNFPALGLSFVVVVDNSCSLADD